MSHVPVLLNEVINTLAPSPGEVYVDCTAGLGGHARAIADRMGRGTIILNDLDPANLDEAAENVRRVPGIDVITIRGNFAELPHVLRERNIRASMVLADLGFASNQIEDASRGFSFQRDGPLDMRMDQTLAVHAGDLVNRLPESELVRILTDYGEESGARRIARKLVEVRGGNPIRTTLQLAHAVHAALGFSGGPIDPATRTFQALRIAVNDELGSLEGLLGLVEQAAGELLSGLAYGVVSSVIGGTDRSSSTWLARGARVAIISFHSLEDRMVKQAFGRITKQHAKPDFGLGAKDLTNGVVTASDAELAVNTRARSAKVRCLRMPDAAR